MKEKNREILWYTLSFLMMTLIIIIFLWADERTFIHKSDGYEQYYPAFLYIGKYLRGVLAGQEIRLYDFSIGLGEGIIDALNYYGFGDPLSLLAVFATARSGEYVFAISVLLRIYLSGIGMICFLKNHGYTGVLVSGGGILYAYSAYTFRQGLSFYTWMNMVYLLPFLLLQAEKLIRDEHVIKNAGKFAVLICISGCCGFYYLYMLTIWVFLFACVDYWFLYHRELDFHHLLLKMGRMLASYCIGIMAAGVILFPSLCSFFNSSRGFGTSEEWFFIPALNNVMENFSNLIIPMNGSAHPGLAVSFLSVLGVIGVWADRGGKGKLKVISAFLFIAYLCPAFGRVMNGFGYASDRWIYVLHFLLVYIAIVIGEEYLEGKVTKTVIIGAFIVAAGSIVYHFGVNGDKIRSGIYFAICLIGMVGMIGKKASANKIYFLLVGGVCANILFYFATWRICGHDMVKDFCTKVEIGEVVSKMKAEDDEFHGWQRKDLQGLTSADCLLSGEYGTSAYFSLLNRCTYSIWKELLISPGIIAAHHLNGLDGRLPVEILLGVDEYQAGGEIRKNPWALPLGVEYMECISEEDFGNLSALAKQGVLLEKIVLKDVDSCTLNEEYESVKKEISYRIETINIESEEGIWKAGINSKIILDFSEAMERMADGELYVLFSDFQCMNVDFAVVCVGDTKLYVQNREGNYYTGLENYLVQVQPDAPGAIEITFQDEYDFKLENIGMYWYSYEGIEENVEKLKEHSLQDVEVSGNKVRGSINAADGWLVFSIPYSRDWKLYVDGSRTEILRANVGFMAAWLEEGTHDIELRYEPLWFKIGACATVTGGILILLMLCPAKVADMPGKAR